MQKKAFFSLVYFALFALLLSSQVYADSNYERPKYKLSFSSGWGPKKIGDLKGRNWYNDYLGEPREIETMFAFTSRDVYTSNNTDLNMRLSLSYNYSGPWYVVGRFQYESWRERKDIRLEYEFGKIGETLYNFTSVMPYLGFEYTNRFWKLEYNTDVGIAYCDARSKVKYVAWMDDEVNLGTYAFNAVGIIVSGGLSYEFIRYTYINTELGYRFFSSDKLEPQDNSSNTPIDFDYDGVFFGIGMSYGFGSM